MHPSLAPEVERDWLIFIYCLPVTYWWLSGSVRFSFDCLDGWSDSLSLYWVLFTCFTCFKVPGRSFSELFEHCIDFIWTNRAKKCLFLIFSFSDRLSFPISETQYNKKSADPESDLYFHRPNPPNIKTRPRPDAKFASRLGLGLENSNAALADCSH